jgi:hypothetical protein
MVVGKKWAFKGHYGSKLNHHELGASPSHAAGRSQPTAGNLGKLKKKVKPVVLIDSTTAAVTDGSNDYYLVGKD